MAGRVIYVGNLPLDTRERELEDLFDKYGRIREIDLKLPPRPPGFAFIEFDDPRDAEDAVRGRDGYDFDGARLRVEISHGGSRRGGDRYDDRRGGGRYDDRRGGYGGGGGGRGRGRGNFAPSRRTEYRVIITNLPLSASWQDLKDHMRKAGEVTYADVFREGEGLVGEVDFANQDDMDYAIDKLDDTEFRNPFDKTYIRIKEARGGGGGDGRGGGGGRDDRDRDDRGRDADRGRSPDDRDRRDDDRDRDRSRSRSRDRGDDDRDRRDRRDDRDDDDDDRDRGHVDNDKDDHDKDDRPDGAEEEEKDAAPAEEDAAPAEGDKDADDEPPPASED